MSDQKQACLWAKELLKKADSVILDTETTGIGNAEIVQVAVINCTGSVLIETLVKPTILIPRESTRIHGITDDMVKYASTFPEIYPSLAKILNGKELIIYAAFFDTKILNYCCYLHQLPLLTPKKVHCAMKWYSQWCGEYSESEGGYTSQTLPGGDHSALGDCLATLKLIKFMADNLEEN